MERVGDRQGQMERYCSTGQSPQRAVAPTEEEEDGIATTRPSAAAATQDRVSRSWAEGHCSIQNLAR